MNEFECSRIAMLSSGYTELCVSPRGAVLFESASGLRTRLATYPSNAATSRWMSDQGGSDITVAGEQPVTPDDGSLEFSVPESVSSAETDYHSDYSHISKSMLNVFCDSSLDYYLMFVSGEKPRKQPTKGMEIGTICHAVILEKKRIEDLVAVYPQSCLNAGGALIPAKAKEFAKRIGKRIAVKEETVEQCESIVRSVMKSELADAMACGGTFEQRYNGELCGLKVKCKPDFCSEDHRVIYDLKFGQTKPDDFWRVAKRFRYGLQDAIYSEILEQNHFGETPFTFRFFAIEPVFPFRIQPFWLDDSSRERCRSHMRTSLNELKSCMETGDWKDRWSNEGTIGPWDFGDNGVFADMEISSVEDCDPE